MSFLFAAIGATLAALVEVTVAPHLAVGDAKPHPVLVIGVIWTIAAGIDRGVVWAFVGGLFLDALTGRPLGVSAFALLVAVGGALVLLQPMARVRTLAPLVAVPVLSLLYSMLIFVLISATNPDVAVADPLAAFTSGAIYDGVIGVLVGPLAISLHDRGQGVERLEW